MRIPIRRPSVSRGRCLAIVGLLTVVGLSLPVGSASAAPLAPARTSASQSDEAGQADDDPTLFVRYGVRSRCEVYPNHPGAGAAGNAGRTWTIAPGGHSVIWRYNVDADWALISDPSRAHVQFPWWGFVHRNCLAASVTQSAYPAGRPVPSRLQTGRSGRPSGWRPVVFDVPPAPVVARRQLHTAATLRDPANFVVGNVFPEWTVEVTGRTRSNGHWVEVHSPDAGRWGYLEASDLR